MSAAEGILTLPVCFVRRSRPTCCYIRSQVVDLAQVQVAGGSGLTPMLQIASEVLRNPDDKTEVQPLHRWHCRWAKDFMQCLTRGVESPSARSVIMCQFSSVHAIEHVWCDHALHYPWC